MYEDEVAQRVCRFQSHLSIVVGEGFQECRLQLWQKLFQHDSNLRKSLKTLKYHQHMKLINQLGLLVDEFSITLQSFQKIRIFITPM